MEDSWLFNSYFNIVSKFPVVFMCYFHDYEHLQKTYYSNIGLQLLS